MQKIACCFICFCIVYFHSITSRSSSNLSVHESEKMNELAIFNCDNLLLVERFDNDCVNKFLHRMIIIQYWIKDCTQTIDEHYVLMIINILNYNICFECRYIKMTNDC
jgi:hypothetical protein